ncbi:MAG: hypothetical protein WC931_04325 [Bacilli bacterium]|jgi:hypothetical protein
MLQTAKNIIAPADANPINSNIDKELLLKIDTYGNVPVYASITAYFIAKLYQPLMCRHTIMRAVSAFFRCCAGDGNAQKLRVLTGGRDHDVLVAIQDEESIVLMFPEDL